MPRTRWSLWSLARALCCPRWMCALNCSGVEPVAVELKRLLDPFRLAQQNLREVWGLVLPASTLVELRRLAGAADRLRRELRAELEHGAAEPSGARDLKKEKP